MSTTLTRRQALLASAGAFSLLVGTSGCKKAQPLSCTNLQGLTPEEVQARTTLGYVDQTTDPTKQCSTCTQWVEPAGEGCGSCKVLKGPMNPNGFCKLYAKKG